MIKMSSKFQNFFEMVGKSHVYSFMLTSETAKNISKMVNNTTLALQSVAHLCVLM